MFNKYTPDQVGAIWASIIVGSMFLIFALAFLISPACLILLPLLLVWFFIFGAVSQETKSNRKWPNG